MADEEKTYLGPITNITDNGKEYYISLENIPEIQAKIGEIIDSLAAKDAAEEKEDWEKHAVYTVEAKKHLEALYDSLTADDKNNAIDTLKEILAFFDGTEEGKTLVSFINGLNVDQTGGDGKYIKSVSQTNGKITAEFQAFETSIAATNASPSTINAPTAKAVRDAIDDLDVSNISGFGAGKTLETLTEKDGKIAATFQNISIASSQINDKTDSYSANGTVAVTGKAIKNAIDGLTDTLNGAPAASKTLTAFDEVGGKVTATFGDISITSSQVSDIQDTYSGTDGKAISGKGVKAAVDGLTDTLTGTPSASKTITAFDEVGGKVSATFSDIAITESQVANLVTDLSNKANDSDVVHIGSSGVPESIYGDKTFYGKLIAYERLAVYGDRETTSSDSDKPADTIGNMTDPDAFYYNTGITISDTDEPELRKYKLIFPAGNGTLALRSDANLIETTWSALKTLRGNGQLIPGRFYRITDYQCTTTQTDTSSAGHQFDIIVTADSANKLNEVARACLHADDTYFASSKLEAWQIWYCIDNDTNRFAWADSTNGKGVVYRMIDEFNNDTPYDFKNILFTTSGKYTNAYTFSYTENDTIKDASLSGLSKSCYSNVVKKYTSSSKQQLNFNIFYSTSAAFNCCSNILSDDCYNNTFSRYCLRNVFGGNCYSNTFGTFCSNNTFQHGCANNTFGAYFYDNTFGAGCCRISTPAYCTHIIIDNGCEYLDISSIDTSSQYLQKVHIHLGVRGTYSSHKIITIPARNLSYETNVYPVGSTEMFI